MRPIYHWNLGSRSLELGKRTLIMGVVNVTPDSFSDGGLYFDADKAVEHALHLLDDGADLIDVGGESTRPGAEVKLGSSDIRSSETNEKLSSERTLSTKQAVTEKEELQRVLPVITAIKQKRPEAVISIDTYKAGVARAAVNQGAEIVNDVSGFHWDAHMAKTIAELKCGAVLMHLRGRPEEWRTLPPLGDPLLLVKRELKQWAEAAVLAGLKRDRLTLDPGFGFGKKWDENYPLLARFDEFQSLGFPMLVGTSRKSFIGRTLSRNGRDAPAEQRSYGTVATQTALILKGAHIIRTHEVRAAVDAARIADAILAAA